MDNIQGHTIRVVDDKTNYIFNNRRNHELLVSRDIKTEWTDDGKLSATFTNRGYQEPTLSDFVKDLCGKRYEPDNSDCSITISDLSKFHYCIRKDGEYQLFGGGITFNGTKGDDKLVMYESENSEINLGDGNDTIKIEGAQKGRFRADFKNNTIKTGEGNDTVTVSGNFNSFINNKFYLGKGNDNFTAIINQEDDALTYKEFEEKLPQYAYAVANNEIFAIEGNTKNGDKKGFFENNVFTAKTYSADRLFKYNPIQDEISGLDGFQLYKFKLEPKQVFLLLAKTPAPKENMSMEPVPPVTSAQQEQNTTKKTKRHTREEYSARYSAGSMGYMLFGDPKLQEAAFKSLEDYVRFMTEN